MKLNRSLKTLTITFLLMTLATASSAAGYPGFGPMLAKIDQSGLVLIASHGGTVEVIDNERELDTLMSAAKPPALYLLDKRTDKRYQVKGVSDGKEDPGKGIWEFFIWLVDQLSK